MRHVSVASVFLEDDINRRVRSTPANEVVICIVVGVGVREREIFCKVSEKIVSFVRRPWDDGCIGVSAQEG